MKKLRGLRLGRTLVRVCRRLLRRRRRPRRAVYVRLGGNASSSPPPASLPSALYALAQHHSSSGTKSKHPTVTAKLLGWGRDLCRRRFPTGGWFHRTPHHHAGIGTAAWGRYDRGGGAKLLPFDYDRGSQPHQRKLQQQQQQANKPPKGHLVVYVGKGATDGGPPPHRVVVPVIYFNHPLFGELLREAEQEYGFHHPGGITIPCPISDFENVRDRVAAASASDPAASDLHVRIASGRIWRWH